MNVIKLISLAVNCRSSSARILVGSKATIDEEPPWTMVIITALLLLSHTVHTIVIATLQRSPLSNEEGPTTTVKDINKKHTL
jgi:hypothetical protein